MALDQSLDPSLHLQPASPNAPMLKVHRQCPFPTHYMHLQARECSWVDHLPSSTTRAWGLPQTPCPWQLFRLPSWIHPRGISLSIPHAPEDIRTGHTPHRAAPWLTRSSPPYFHPPLNRETDTCSREGSGPFPSCGPKAYPSAYGVGNVLSCSVQKEWVSQMDRQWVGR